MSDNLKPTLEQIRTLPTRDRLRFTLSGDYVGSDGTVDGNAGQIFCNDACADMAQVLRSILASLDAEHGQVA